MAHAPRLRFTGEDAQVEAVVLLLHGGTPDSLDRVRGFDSGVLRMFPFGRSVVRAAGGRIALATLRYAVRGWNSGQESPLPDARWALDRIAERFGNLPVGLVGHSMGGRVALRVADHQVADRGAADHGVADRGVADRGGVRSVAALAPWLPPGEPTPAMKGRSVLLAHGTADRRTDPTQTFGLAGRLSAQGVDVELVKFGGAGHAMLFPARPWHDLVAGFMVRTLLAPAPGGPSGSAGHLG